MVAAGAAGEHAAATVGLPAAPVCQRLAERAGAGKQLLQPGGAEAVPLVPGPALGLGPLLAVQLGHAVPDVPAHRQEAHCQPPAHIALTSATCIHSSYISYLHTQLLHQLPAYIARMSDTCTHSSYISYLHTQLFRQTPAHIALTTDTCIHSSYVRHLHT